MNKYVYAILSEDQLCEGVFAEYYQALKNVPPNYILIDESNKDFVTYRKYINGQWSSEKYPPPEPEPMPTLEEMTMQTLLNTEYLVILSEIENM